MDTGFHELTDFEKSEHIRMAKFLNLRSLSSFLLARELIQLLY